MTNKEFKISLWFVYVIIAITLTGLFWCDWLGAKSSQNQLLRIDLAQLKTRVDSMHIQATNADEQKNLRIIKESLAIAGERADELARDGKLCK